VGESLWEFESPRPHRFRLNGKQIKRRIGPGWVRRRSPPPDGAFTEGAAHDRAREIMAEVAAAMKARNAPRPSFRQVADDYLDWLQRVRGAKPSTLADYRTTLAEPRERMSGRIMAAIGDRPAAEAIPPSRSYRERWRNKRVSVEAVARLLLRNESSRGFAVSLCDRSRVEGALSRDSIQIEKVPQRWGRLPRAQRRTRPRVPSRCKRPRQSGLERGAAAYCAELE
jgi:hypothetical protein